MEEYYFERVSPTHYGDLEYISKSAFGFKPGEDYYKLKNATDTFGESHLGFIAYHTETKEPAAFYGVYSYPIINNGSTIKAVQSGDTMTHQKHTGKGLFTTLAKKTYALAKEKGAAFVFGFPNDNSYPGFVKKLNWIHRDNIKVYKWKIYTLPLLKAAKKIKALRPVYDLYSGLIIKLYQPADAAFGNSNQTSGAAVVDHSVNFFNYKSFSGCKVILINNFKVWIKPDGFLFIGDIQKEAQNDFKSFLNKLKIFAFLIGADIIQFASCPGGLWEKKLDEKFNPEKGAAFGYCVFTDFNMDHFLYTQGDLDTF